MDHGHSCRGQQAIGRVAGRYIAIYKNGQRRGEAVSLSQFNVTSEESDAPFHIGTRDLESFFEGAIGKVAVYDGGLSDLQINATYETMVSGTGIRPRADGRHPSTSALPARTGSPAPPGRWRP